MTDKTNILQEFEPLFFPKSLAVVGATSDESLKVNIGNRFIEVLLEFGFTGKLYAVGIKEGEVSGLKIYQNVKDIPSELDYVIAVIPNRLIPQLVEDCGQKGVKVIHLFVSGFGEIEDKMGAELQEEILHIAKNYGIRLIGPNCMGTYCPSARLTFAVGFSAVAGRVGYLSQSGGQSILGIKEANRRNIFFSKVVS